MHDPRCGFPPHSVGWSRHYAYHSPEAAAVGRLNSVEFSSVIHRQSQFAPNQNAVRQLANRFDCPDARSLQVVIDLGHPILISSKMSVVGQPEATLVIHCRGVRRPVRMILEDRYESPLPALNIKLAPSADGDPHSSAAVRCGRDDDHRISERYRKYLIDYLGYGLFYKTASIPCPDAVGPARPQCPRGLTKKKAHVVR